MQHGYHTVEIRGDVIIVSLIGDFNEPSIMDYIEDVENLIIEMQGKPTYMIVNDFELNGITPEGYQQLEVHNQWLLTQNLLAKAIVSDRTIQDHLDFKWAPTLKKLNSRHFTDMQSAEEWVDELKKQRD